MGRRTVLAVAKGSVDLAKGRAVLAKAGAAVPAGNVSPEGRAKAEVVPAAHARGVAARGSVLVVAAPVARPRPNGSWSTP
jgi:hypothetical protein